MSVVFNDGTRATPARGSVPGHSGRTLSTTLRWPVADGGVAPGDHPLVIFAHGFDVRAGTYSALLDDLAAAGAIVAAPELPGESTALAGPPNENDLANEPCDLIFVTKSLLRQPPAFLAPALLHAPIVYAGHSDGATAAAAAAYSNEPCDGPTPAAVVALSPNDVSIDRVPSPRAPALLAVTGTLDEVNPLPNTEMLWQHAPRPAWFLTVAGGSHLGTFTTDPDRPQLDAIIATFVTAHTLTQANVPTTAAHDRFRLYAR